MSDSNTYLNSITSWHSYPSIYALGHAQLTDLLLDPVLVEEKIDGSQFSFGIFDGELKVRSKGCQMIVDAPEKMFSFAVDYVKSIKDKLVNGWTYRAEYLRVPKHNVLCYDRIPKNHLVVFDINTAEEVYLSKKEKQEAAAAIGLEVVPAFYEGKLDSIEMFRELLNTKSCLGGVDIEGVVVKNYFRFDRSKKALMGKFVSEAFKEVHKVEWKSANPGQGDILQILIGKYKNQARWLKAMQRLRDAGQLEVSPRDIGKLMTAVKEDIKKECEEEIKEELFKWGFHAIERSVVGGLPEWYKEQLLKLQFEKESSIVI